MKVRHSHQHFAFIDVCVYSSRQSERTDILQCTRIDNRPKQKRKKQKLLITFYCLIVIRLLLLHLFFVNHHPLGLLNTFSFCHWFYGIFCASSDAPGSIVFSFFPFSVVLHFFYDFCCSWINIFARYPGVWCSRHVTLTVCMYIDRIFKWVSFTQTQKSHAFIEYVDNRVEKGLVNWLIEFNSVRRLPRITIYLLVCVLIVRRICACVCMCP